MNYTLIICEMIWENKIFIAKQLKIPYIYKTIEK